MTIFAPAKINLYLHVTGQRPDGYHTLDSLVVFTKDIGDRLTINSNTSQPGHLTLSGDHNHTLQTDVENNLILKAARLLAERSGQTLDVNFHLEKNLPVASGIGGGSSDAAACLKALSQYWGIDNNILLESIAESLGADIPVCLKPQPVVMRGIGEELLPLSNFPDFHIVLANPLVAVETPNIFKSYHETSPRYSEITPLHEIPRDLGNLIEFLSMMQNDLTQAACLNCPEIQQVIDEVNATEGCLLSRMSGSGATCFGLYATSNAAQKAQEKLQLQHPNWWVKSSVIYR